MLIDHAPGEPESYLHLRDLAKQRWLPRPRGRAKRPAISTFHRWRAGVRGVRLKCVRTPGGWATKRTWVEEFFQELTRAQGEQALQPSPADVHVRAEQSLDAAGI